MRLPRLAAASAAALGAGLAAFAAAPAAQAAQSAAASSSNPAAGAIYSVPMISGPATVHRDLPPDPASGWRPGRSGSGSAPGMWLKASVSGPAFGGDYRTMYYSLGVVNSKDSQATATGLVVRMRMLTCARPDEPDAQCALGRTYTERIDSLAPGQSYIGIIPVALSDVGPTPAYLRFTPEISSLG